MKLHLTFLMALCFGIGSQARQMQHWTWDTLNARATLIVVATPSSISATTERTNVLGNIDVVGVETSFKVLTDLKGDLKITTLVLHHYALVEAHDIKSINDGLQLIAFEPKERKQYLIFLQQDSDGRYAPVTGQADAALSFAEFAGGAPPELDPKNAKGVF